MTDSLQSFIDKLNKPNKDSLFDFLTKEKHRLKYTPQLQENYNKCNVKPPKKLVKKLTRRLSNKILGIPKKTRKILKKRLTRRVKRKKA